MKKLLFLFAVIALVSCQSGSKKTNTDDSKTPTSEIVESTVNIGGMYCDMCVASIEKGVNELEGISEVAVSLNDSNAIVKYDKSIVQLEDIEKAIEKRGYSIK